jgi:hypothetical protein
LWLVEQPYGFSGSATIAGRMISRRGPGYVAAVRAERQRLNAHDGSGIKIAIKMRKQRATA